MEGMDVRSCLAAWLEVVTGMTVADIAAIPDDKWNEPFGGCTRPGAALLADTVTNLNWTTAALKGQESDAYSHMASLASDFGNKCAGIDAFKAASAEMATALRECSDETLSSSILALWQMPTPVWMLAHIAVSHIWYHDGQFNYIQSLLGDDKVHWMGD